MKQALLLALVCSPLSGFAAPECSPCAAYGSPFGPEGYSYYCFFVKEASRVVYARRFDDRESCLETRGSLPICRYSGTHPTRGADPCWKL